MQGGIAYALVIIGIAVFAEETWAFCKICNISDLIERSKDPRSYYYRRALHTSVSRDASYLPEEDYNDDREAKILDQQHLDRDSRNLMPEYQSLCETVMKRVRFDDKEYEYQPQHYHEIFCKSYSLLDDNERSNSVNPTKQKCAHPGFHCVQRSRTLFVVRRHWDSECWEPLTKEIASGCDCMWPVSTLGDISAHY